MSTEEKSVFISQAHVVLEACKEVPLHAKLEIEWAELKDICETSERYRLQLEYLGSKADN